jgi:3-hydroxyacyl-[acyl-carrier-protein] dehydratase
VTEAPAREERFVVDPRHPSLAGHFPGNPVLPGVVVLDRVISAAEAWLGGDWRVGGLPQVKFASPLRPGDEATIRLVLREGGVHFAVRCQERMVAQGVLSPSGGGTRS